MEYFGTNLILLSPIIVGILNLLTPFISKEDTNTRSAFLLSISGLFLLNVIILDYLFLNGYGYDLTLFSIGKYSLSFHLEALGMVFLTLLASLWICALLYTIKFLAINDMPGSDRFLFFMNGCIIIGSFIALSSNLFTLFVGYELLTVCTIPLIAHFPNERCFVGLYKYLKILIFSSMVLFLPAILIIYSCAGHGNFTPNGFIADHVTDTQAMILFLMIIFGCAKAAIYPFHTWLPAAMVATYPVSAILHAVVVVKTGLFCIYKIIIYVFGVEYLYSLFGENNWLVLLPIITIIYSSFQAVRYTDVKAMLAYSTINQLSIALLSAFLLTPKGINAAIFHMVSHSFTKICIFYTAGNIYSVKTSYRISELIGIKTTMPRTSFILLISGLSLIGVPPFAGFISKLYILLAAVEEHNLLVICTLMASSLFSALYVIKMLIFVYRPTSDDFILHLKLKPYFNEPRESRNSKRIISSKYKAEKKLPKFMILSIALCVCGVVGFVFIQRIINQFLLFI
ncbi:MAG: hypothetical protein DGJ47_000806 [Rickettsiaceae bacterium]